MEGVLDVSSYRTGTLYANGTELAYVEFGQVDPALKLVHESEDYWYVRTLPLKGYGALIDRQIRELEADDKKAILALFWDRIYIYATDVTPIGTGKK